MGSRATKEEARPQRRRDCRLKLLPLCILRILEQGTDAEHPLSIEDIRRRVEAEYGIEVDRKTVSNNLSWLAELDERVRPDVKERSDGQGGVQEVSCGWHCEPALEAEELRYLADALFSCPRMPPRQKRDLWQKVSALGGARAKKLAGFGDFYDASPQPAVNRQLFRSIDVLNDALGNGWQASFSLGSLDLEGRFCQQAGERRHVVDPRFMAMSDGRHYLFASYPSAEIPPGDRKMYSFRIDLMFDAEIPRDRCGEPRKATVPPDRHPDIRAYLDKHLYTYSDPIVAVLFRFEDTDANRNLVFDRFGSAVRLARVDGGAAGARPLLEASVQANENAMRFFAMQYSDVVEVLKPQSLRDALHEEGLRVAKRYAGGAPG
ncbi:WYL domain-containing protein [Arabiibacter massiliensis]|uniref:WYL domain-containing protein n=1 Tax=Arabiibacter massiliensis TaxID=1870985 RepID=UPI00155B2F30|nr:WYL domain-containing protein [Arabiibacter massiliensis]